jgi:hypothetical protein
VSQRGTACVSAILSRLGVVAHYEDGAERPNRNGSTLQFVGELPVSRPTRIPDRGDVPPGKVAQRLGLSLADFELRRPDLHSRGFPPPDPTTGCYCIEAVDRWRLSRHKDLFPELLAAPFAINAAAVFDERLRGLGG